MMRRTCGFLTFLLAIAGGPAATQTIYREANSCEGISSDRAYHCEIREETLAGGSPLSVDASPNGGIRVSGWDRAEVAIRARVVAYADSEQDARQLASEVRISTGGGQVEANGPDRERDTSWVVSYEVSVPQNSNVTLKTVNGGVRLENVGGEIRGETNNGGLTIDLRGDRWDGAGLDVETHNGGVRLNLPANYSAELEAGTTNGRLNIEFPVTVQGKIGKRLMTTLGAGGPKIRAVTYNGGVSIRRQ
jgi:hypothetical protein